MRASLRRRVLRRDNGCVIGRLFGVAGDCSSDLHVHHIVPRRDGGPDRLDNLVAVCSAHHGAVEALRRRLTADLPPCPHYHPYPQGRADCDRRRRRALLAA